MYVGESPKKKKFCKVNDQRTQNLVDTNCKNEMHSPLSKHKHPNCIEQIDALNACHRDNPWLKFIGVCNVPAAEVTRCFKAERSETRSKNLAQAREKNQIIDKIVGK